MNPYRTALYMRLSKDDDGAKESASIGTQRKMLHAYAKENGYMIHDEYVDDGYSGTTFNRPEFQRMIADIEAGRINLVLTKDLSRLGRDYIATGQYTELYFPEHHVRYIAINDGYDSIDPYNDIAPFRHVINEMYARDTSKKIRSAFVTKMKEGSYIASFAPYGYQKDPTNKNHLLIDEEAASVVKALFEMAERGERPSEIADRLNGYGVMTPAMYRCKKHPHLDLDRYSKRREWTSSMICKMLKNIVYLGHTAQGKTAKVSFKSRLTQAKPQEEWYVVRDTHAPIISQATYDNVQKRSISRRRAPKTAFQNIFSGIAKCGDCNRNMSITGGGNRDGKVKLVCGGYKLYGRRTCTNHLIDYEALYRTVLQALGSQVCLSEREKQELRTYVMSQRSNQAASQRQTIQRTLTNRTRTLDQIIQHLYEDLVGGKLTNARFERMLAAYEAEQKEIAARLERLSTAHPTAEQDASDRTALTLLEELFEGEMPPSELLRELIDHIEIGQRQDDPNMQGHQCQQIKIFYRFRNPDPTTA